MYANLLASSLDIDTCKNAHPAFVEMINAMSPDEAKIMRLFATEASVAVVAVQEIQNGTRSYRTVARNFSRVGVEAGCENPTLAPSYLDNLGRMGLIQLPPPGALGGVVLADKSRYKPIEEDPSIADFKAQIESRGNELQLSRSVVELTELGQMFCQACVVENTHGSR